MAAPLHSGDPDAAKDSRPPMARSPDRRKLGPRPLLLLGILAGPLHGGSACEDGRFMPPGLPTMATEHNGVALADVCFNGAGPHHIFVIGDWGGVQEGEGAPSPADHRAKPFPQHRREFVKGVDDVAQLKVASMMGVVAAEKNPDFIINVGDSFYWGGIRGHCGAPILENMTTEQWRHTFEDVYTGPGLSGKQWLGVLGNHDYGGYSFTSAWDQVIAYTWGRDQPYSQDRWMMPAQFWSVKVFYTDFDSEGLRADFSVDYYFVDSNVWDAAEPSADPEHNICSLEHNNNNQSNASCADTGPEDVWHCVEWFTQLWEKQKKWLSEVLPKSTAEWQIVVTHFPPTWGQSDWKELSRSYGIDLIITGHEHFQAVYYNETYNFLWPTAWIISGGGGGITSEYRPELDGEDDQYGFMDLTLSRSSIKIEAYSHGGQIRSTTVVHEGGKGDFEWTTTTTTTSSSKVHRMKTKTKSHFRNSTVPSVGKNGSIDLSKKNATGRNGTEPLVGKNGSAASLWGKKNATARSSNSTKNGGAAALAVNRSSNSTKNGSAAALLVANRSSNLTKNGSAAALLMANRSSNLTKNGSAPALPAANRSTTKQSGGNAYEVAASLAAAQRRNKTHRSGNNASVPKPSQVTTTHRTPASQTGSVEGHKRLRRRGNRTSVTTRNNSRGDTAIGMSSAAQHGAEGQEEDDCHGACVLAAGHFPCHELITWLAENWYQRSERPCKAAYIEALHQCKSCYGCPLAKSGCRVQYSVGENDTGTWAQFDSKNHSPGLMTTLG